jgi:hypothetical protein
MTGRDTIDVGVYWTTMEGSREVEHEAIVTLDVEYTRDESDPSVGVGSVVYLDTLTVLEWPGVLTVDPQSVLWANEERIEDALRALWESDAADHGRRVRL